MNFVYIHIVLFTVWMLVIEHKPWPTLTLVVPAHDRAAPAFIDHGTQQEKRQ